jgi:2-hydroxycyclohexanecarboxyl-CoA dehydrogenase
MNDVNGSGLAGRVAIVTAGGGASIGASYSRALAREGAAVVIADLDEAGATAVAGEIRAAGGQALAVPTDISKAEEVEALVERARSEFGEIGILVNHAGMGASVRLEDLTEELWDRAMGVSLRGTYLCIRAVAPSMKRLGWGRIVNTVSRAAYRPGVGAARRGVAAYVANKAGIIGFSRALAIELGPDSITVNCIAPGTMRASGNYRELGYDAPLTLEQRQRAAESEGQALPPKPGEPEDIAGALLYLVGPYSNHVTGMIMHVNGGSYLPA